MKFQYPTWWGGVAASEEPPQIAAKLKELREKVGFLKAEEKKGGPRFAIKSAKDLMAKLRPALDELGMVCFTHAQTGGNIPLVPVVDGEGDVVGGEGTLSFIMATVRIGCEDGSYVDVVGCGHGADSQDKAGGKSSTYAWKDALIKGLALPDAEIDDTDDEEKPIKGGLRQKGKPKAPAANSKKAPKPSLHEVRDLIESATGMEALKSAGKLAQQLSEEDQTALLDEYNAKKAELSK